MKIFLIASALLVTMSAAQAKTKHKKAKLSREDAKELCLSTKGAEISKKELKKCTSKAMRTGKV